MSLEIGDEQRATDSLEACILSVEDLSVSAPDADTPLSSASTHGADEPMSWDASRQLVQRNNRAEHAEVFWTDVIRRTFQRALSESWTQEDIEAAVMQGSLLAYRSHEAAADDYGFRYVESAPEGYAHNCPWNDWTPPSESARLFQAAATTPYVDPVSRRIRVHVVTSADITAHGMVAFATVEMNVKGKEVLVVRRGTETLASLVLRRIHLTSCLPVDKMLIELKVATSRPGVPSIYLRFEDVKRLEAFIVMMRRP
jgi:hypothetical protein